MHPERNDVEINKLFNWGREVEIFDRYGKKIASAYIRLVGDIDINKARVVGLRRSAELRRQLKTKDSDERVAFIEAAIEGLTREDLIEYTTMFKIREFSMQAAKEVVVSTPKELKSDATLEEQEKFQKAVDEYDEKRSVALTDYVVAKLKDEKQKLLALNEEELHRLYEQYVINDLCEKKMLITYKECCVYFGSYSDPEFSHRMFSSFEQFENLPTEIKEQYVNAYDTMEINIDELKKLLEATQ